MSDVRDRVKKVLKMLGVSGDDETSPQLFYSWITSPKSPMEPIERCHVQIPDEWVAKVADRIAELEAEVAQLKAQDAWHDGVPSESGWYWFQVNGGKPEVGEFELFDCWDAGMRWNLYSVGMEEPLRPEDGITLKWKRVRGSGE